MKNNLLLDPVKILYRSNSKVVHDAVLIINNELVGFGEDARKQGKKEGLTAISAVDHLIAPCLIDPHSVLEDPIKGKNENLISLKKAALRGGYGQIALLPRSRSSWRDQPEKLQFICESITDVKIHAWASFSKEGLGKDLSAHADLLRFGAIGFADDDFIITPELLKKGLLLNEVGDSPVLVAPRDKKLQGMGIVREGVEALRAGWLPDPVESEIFPLSQLIELYKQHPECSLRLMNISTEKAVEYLMKEKRRPLSTVCWWHLISDSKNLHPLDEGWKVSPSIGSASDRKAPIYGLKESLITAISVNSIPIDEEENLLPPDKRQPGIAGHHLVLPTMWNELIKKHSFSIEELWELLSFGPARFLRVPEEHLHIGSKRWLIFNPNFEWTQNRFKSKFPLAANQPLQNKKITGKVIYSGLET